MIPSDAYIEATCSGLMAIVVVVLVFVLVLVSAIYNTECTHIDVEKFKYDFVDGIGS